jgi:hypothetical protein
MDPVALGFGAIGMPQPVMLLLVALILFGPRPRNGYRRH